MLDTGASRSIPLQAWKQTERPYRWLTNRPNRHLSSVTGMGMGMVTGTQDSMITLLQHTATQRQHMATQFQRRPLLS
jgi:hypothetical protein